MAKLDGADPGTVAWVDLQTPDLDTVRKFYGELLGWSFAGADNANAGFYVMAQLGGRNVAGMVKLSSESRFPPMWSVYIATESADAIATKVREAGGKIVMPPMDVMDQGTMAYFADPTCAGAQVVAEPGAMTFHEVYTRDATKARAFYASVFGLESKRLDEPNIEYWTLSKGTKTAFGVMQMSDQFGKDVPSHWNTYFAVTDVDASAKTVTSLGGQVAAPPFDTPYGRIAVVVDPLGAAFCLMTPTAVV